MHISRIHVGTLHCTSSSVEATILSLAMLGIMAYEMSQVVFLLLFLQKYFLFVFVFCFYFGKPKMNKKIFIFSIVVIYFSISTTKLS